MAVENPIWGEERIASELRLKLGLNGERPRREPDPKQRWLTFIHNHNRVIVASDFLELGTRRILHHNITADLTAEWTLQQIPRSTPGRPSLSIRDPRPR